MVMNTWRLIQAIAIAVFMVGLQLDPWILGAGLLFILWKIAIEYWQLAKPSRWLTNTLTVFAFALLLLKYRTMLNQEASSSFLLLLTSLKLLEERSLRDQKFLFLLGFVLIASLFLFSLEIPVLAGGLLSFFLLWSAQNREAKYTVNLLKSLPFVLLLFLFFPRVQNPFGLQGMDNGNSGFTGFSDDLNPGSISKIQSSRELAFRVQFLNPNLKPQTIDQYWRGQILHFSEGLRWVQSPSPQIPYHAEKFQNPDYEVTLERQNKKWLFVWDSTEAIESKDFPFQKKDELYFESMTNLRERVTYRGKIYDSAFTAESDKRDLQTPPASDRLKNFVAQLKNKAPSRQDFIMQVLKYFKNEHFLYSKSPGNGSNNLDDFLFNNKKGYCEHYAATLATLLRLAQIPAHVVTGYQGGEYNAYGKFWKFTQADAHAWVEYINDQNQWERIDPTAFVAPERLELGGALFEDLPEEWIGQNKALDFLKTREAWWHRSREFVMQSFDSLNYDLTLFLLDFDLEKQKELLQNYRVWAYALVILILLPFLVLSFTKRRRLSYSEWFVKEIDKKARRYKVAREKSETLRQFFDRWAEAQPEIKNSLLQLLALFETSEYSKNSSPASSTKARQMLRDI